MAHGALELHAKKPKSMSGSGQRDDGRMDGRGSGRGCGRGTDQAGLAPRRCRGVRVSTSSSPAPASSSTNTTTTSGGAAHVCLCRALVPSTRRLCPAARTPPNARCGEHSPLSALRSPLSTLCRTHPRAGLRHAAHRTRQPPTPTITSARDAGQSHSPPRTRAVRPREEAGAARYIQGHGERFSTRSFSSRARCCAPRKGCCCGCRRCEGLLVAGPRAGDSGGGDRLILAPPEWEQRG
ncbi:hypothetical protein B0H14DRAFT_3866928, partial [Mycena olivaceomarginata]